MSPQQALEQRIDALIKTDEMYTRDFLETEIENGFTPSTLLFYV